MNQRIYTGAKHINPFQPFGDVSTKPCTLVLLLLLQCACGGGDDLLLGTSQQPDPAVQDFALAYVKRPLLVDGAPFPNTNPALFADAGETMAQVYTRINGVPEPDPDLVFNDVWTDPALRVPDAGFAHRYSDLQTPAPIDPGCISNWQSNCRIVTNYEDVIHPIFGVDRQPTHLHWQGELRHPFSRVDPHPCWYDIRCRSIALRNEPVTSSDAAGIYVDHFHRAR